MKCIGNNKKKKNIIYNLIKAVLIKNIYSYIGSILIHKINYIIKLHSTSVEK